MPCWATARLPGRGGQEQPPPPPPAAKHPGTCLNKGKGKGEARPGGSGQSASGGTYQDVVNRSSRTALISCGVESAGGGSAGDGPAAPPCAVSTGKRKAPSTNLRTILVTFAGSLASDSGILILKRSSLDRPGTRTGLRCRSKKIALKRNRLFAVSYWPSPVTKATLPIGVPQLSLSGAGFRFGGIFAAGRNEDLLTQNGSDERYDQARCSSLSLTHLATSVWQLFVCPPDVRCYIISQDRKSRPTNKKGQI